MARDGVRVQVRPFAVARVARVERGALRGGGAVRARGAATRGRRGGGRAAGAAWRAPRELADAARDLGADLRAAMRRTPRAGWVRGGRPAGTRGSAQRTRLPKRGSRTRRRPRAARGAARGPGPRQRSSRPREVPMPYPAAGVRGEPRRPGRAAAVRGGASRTAVPRERPCSACPWQRPEPPAPDPASAPDEPAGDAEPRHPPPTVRTLYAARQPILGRDSKLEGYEILFRGGPENRFDAPTRTWPRAATIEQGAPRSVSTRWSATGART